MMLVLDESGPGSRAELVNYIRIVLEQRTDVHDDTNADRLARGITTSVLARLGVEWRQGELAS